MFMASTTGKQIMLTASFIIGILAVCLFFARVTAYFRCKKAGLKMDKRKFFFSPSISLLFAISFTLRFLGIL